MSQNLWDNLFEPVKKRPSTVSEISARIRDSIATGVGDVWVEGEISSFSASSAGHWYFNLTDGEAMLKAVCFKNRNVRVRFQPDLGFQVRCRGQISVYESRGEYQLIVGSMQPVGEGAFTAAFERIKEKLFAEGLFDQELKRQIPLFPRRVGVVTSPTGAALHDIADILGRRAGSIHLTVIPASVQGENSVRELISAIDTANQFNRSCSENERIDVLIVSRGGGSAEDLASFNDERLARAIRASEIPVISAVGHEIDYTIADLVADMRAPTPSAAAELVAATENEMASRLTNALLFLRRSMMRTLLDNQNRLSRNSLAMIADRMLFRSQSYRHELERTSSRISTAAKDRIDSGKKRLADSDRRRSPVFLNRRAMELKMRFERSEKSAAAAVADAIAGSRRRLEGMTSKLDALSPLAVLTRGYSITEDLSGNIIRSAKRTNTGQALRIRLAEGEIAVEVKEAE